MLHKKEQEHANQQKNHVTPKGEVEAGKALLDLAIIGQEPSGVNYISLSTPLLTPVLGRADKIPATLSVLELC